MMGNNKYIKGENVLGYIEGSDLKEELIVITAHYDHLGKHEEKIYNGADDDGSGTVALMEIAEAFMIAKQTLKKKLLYKQNPKKNPNKNLKQKPKRMMDY